MARVYGYTEQDAKRILQYVRQQSDAPYAHQVQKPFIRRASVMLLEVTTAVTAASGSTPGTGTAKFLWRNPETDTIEDMLQGDTAAEETVYNAGPYTCAVGEWVHCVDDPFGSVWLDKRLAATRYRGLINDGGGFAITDSTTAMDNLVAIDGLAYETELATVHNVMSWSGSDNAVAIAEYTVGASGGRWELRMVACA